MPDDRRADTRTNRHLSATRTDPPPATANTPARTTDPWATVAYAGLPPPLTTPVDDWPPGLTRYRPEYALGGGGMGVVYLCHDTQLDRQVAIKFPRNAAPATADRILAEARAAARLHHPNICPVFDADVCDGVPYLTMAFVPGPTLAAELKRLGRYPPAVAAEMIRTVAEAMRYAHENGVIHRDLKPANILLTLEREPVVTDFGLAVRHGRQGVAEGVIEGTPHYMSPEQAAGESERIDELTDVFALGVILFEMLTGRVPFRGEVHQVLEQVRTKPVPPVRELRKDVPPALALVVAKATARHPADRYDGMAAFADALTHFLRTAQAPPKKSRAWVVWAVAIPATVLLGGGMLLYGLGLLRPPSEKGRDAAKPTAADQAEVDRRVADLTREAKELVATGSLDEGREKYTAALELNPNAVAPREARAELYERMGRQQDALTDFDALIGLNPAEVLYRKGRAEMLLQLDRPAEVVDEMTAALRTHRDNPVLLTLRGAARVARGEHKDALTDLDLAVELHPTNARGLRLRSEAKRALGDKAGAAADDSRAADLEAGK